MGLNSGTGKTLGLTAAGTAQELTSITMVAPDSLFILIVTSGNLKFKPKIVK